MLLSLGISYHSYHENVGNSMLLRIAHWGCLELIKGLAPSQGLGIFSQLWSECYLGEPLHLWNHLIFLIYKMKGMNSGMLQQNKQGKLQIYKIKMEKKTVSNIIEHHIMFHLKLKLPFKCLPFL